MFSATLKTPYIKTLSDYLCLYPTLIDLNSDNIIPDGVLFIIFKVYHSILRVDPLKLKIDMKKYPYIKTDEIHKFDIKSFDEVPLDLQESQVYMW